MKRAITIIAIIVLALAVIVGLGIGLSRWLGDMFWDYDPMTFV